MRTRRTEAPGKTSDLCETGRAPKSPKKEKWATQRGSKHSRPLRGSVSCGSGWSEPCVSIQLTLSQIFAWRVQEGI